MIHVTELAEADQSESLFDSLPSVEYRKLEEEFDKIALNKSEDDESEDIKVEVRSDNSPAVTNEELPKRPKM